MYAIADDRPPRLSARFRIPGFCLSLCPLQHHTRGCLCRPAALETDVFLRDDDPGIPLAVSMPPRATPKSPQANALIS